MTHFYLNINPQGDLNLRAFYLETGALYCIHCPDLHVTKPYAGRGNVFVTYLTRG